MAVVNGVKALCQMEVAWFRPLDRRLDADTRTQAMPDLRFVDKRRNVRYRRDTISPYSQAGHIKPRWAKI